MTTEEKEKELAMFEKLGVISRLNTLKLAARSIKRIPHLFSSFREGKVISRFEMSRET